MIAPENITPLQPEQLEFEGIPVREKRFSLKSGTNLLTRHPMSIGARVKGNFIGVVDAIMHQRDKNGALVRVAHVTVLEADVSEVHSNRDMDPAED